MSKITEDQKIFTATWMVFQAIIDSGRLDSTKDFAEKWRTMENLTSSYFSIRSNLEDANPHDMQFRQAFLFEAMAYAIIVEAHNTSSFAVSKFDMVRVLERFNTYLEEEAKSGA